MSGQARTYVEQRGFAKASLRTWEAEDDQETLQLVYDRLRTIGRYYATTACLEGTCTAAPEGDECRAQIKDKIMLQLLKEKFE